MFNKALPYSTHIPPTTHNTHIAKMLSRSTSSNQFLHLPHYCLQKMPTDIAVEQIQHIKLSHCGVYIHVHYESAKRNCFMRKNIINLAQKIALYLNMVFSLSYITISSLNVYNMMLTELCRMMTSLLSSKSLCRCRRSGIKEENKPKRDKIAIFRMADFLPNCIVPIQMHVQLMIWKNIVWKIALSH